MKIKISLNKQEVKDIIKKHVLKEFPVDTKDQEVYVAESYGNYTVEIEERIEPTDQPNSEE